MKDMSLIIIALVIIFLVVAPSIVSGVGKFFGDIGDFVKYGFQETASSGAGSMTAEVILYYTDGTSRKISSPTIVPLSIPDPTGGDVDHITYTISVMLGLSGQINSVEVSGTDTIKVSNSVEVGNFLDRAMPERSFSAWTDKETKSVYTNTIYTTDIETFMSSHNAQNGDYYLKWTPKLDVTVAFTSGQTDHKSAESNVVSWQFNYAKSQITSINIFVTMSTLG